MRRGYTSPRGFSLLELLVVVATGVVLTAISLMAVQQSVPEARANAALRLLKGLLVYARDEALSQRRSVEVQFLGSQEVRIFRVNLDGTRTELRRNFFEGNMVYQVYPAVPDTPDAFGRSAAVTFPNGRVLFSADGAAVDATAMPVSGTVFLGRQTTTSTARAVTLFGATGRVAGYRWNGRAWVTM